jgi:hypothetical protein
MNDSKTKTKRGRKPNVAPEALPEHIETSILIGFGKAVGLNKNQIAEHLGVVKQNVYRYEEKYGVLINTVEARAKLLTAASIATQVKDATKVREAQYVKALNNMGGFLDDAEDKDIQYKASIDTIDRFEGKAKQRIEQHTHQIAEARVVLPIEEIKALRALIQGSSALLLPPKDVIEAEVIEGAASEQG